ncbi:hypothetical protein [Comamonas testosteroni]|uniref:hypothetical protein n=1 Tax=Comamonas testosteroni TaxID=285 RepID=UPI0026EF64BE|nr:hypothetical protein [Comamonas testosteroni]
MYLGQYEQEHNPHYLGRGMLYAGPAMRDWATGMPPGRRLGNASGLVVTPDVRRLRTSPWDSRSNAVLDGVAVSVQLYGHGAANLAMALNAQRLATASARITTTVDVSGLLLPAGAMLWTPHQVDLQQAVQAVPSWANWTEGTEWRRADWGIELLQGIFAPQGATVRITSTAENSAEQLDAGNGGDPEIGLAYAGINKADGKPMRLQCYRCRPLLDAGLTLLDQAASSIRLTLQLRPVHRIDRPAAWYDLARAAYKTI